MDRLHVEYTVETNSVVFYDVSRCVKSWGRRGIILGSLVGLALGVAFVAIPHSGNVLTFGVIGTLMVGAMEGAVIAGAFGACAAALYGKGSLRGRDAKSYKMVLAGRRPANGGWRDGDIPLSDWPTKWEYPGSPSPRRHKKR